MEAGTNIADKLKLLAQFAGLSEDITWVTDLPTGQIIYANRDVMAMHGFTPEDWLQVSPQERLQLIHPDDRALIDAYYGSFTHLTGDDEVRTLEFRGKTSTGHWMPMMVRGRVFDRNHDGSVRSVLSTARNITGQKQAEREIIRLKDEAALRAEDKYHNLFSSMSEGFIVCELIYNVQHEPIDWKWLEVNPAFERHIYLKKESIIGRRRTEVFPVMDEDLLRKYAGVVETQKPVEFEEYSKASGGWLYIRALPFGKNQFAVLFENIDKRKKAEEALRESEERLRTVLGSIGEPFYALDSNWRFLFASHAALQTWQKPAEAVLGRRFLEAFPEATGSAAYAAHQRVMQTGIQEHLETMSAVFGRWVELDISRAASGGLTVSFRDISARKAAEALLRADEERQAFLLRLSDVLRPLTDADAIQQTAARLVGERLNVSRAYYFSAEKSGEEGRYIHVISKDYFSRPHMKSIVGRHLQTSSGENLYAGFVKGQKLVVADIDQLPEVFGEYKRRYRLIGIQSFVAVPLMRNGEYVAAFGVNDSVVRQWTANEIAIIEETAERTWAAVERAKAEEALRRSEDKFRVLFNSMDEGYCIIQMVYDSEGKACDWHYLEVNPAFERHNGIMHAAGKNMRDLVPDIEQKWVGIYGQVAETGQSVRFEEDSEALGRTFDLYAFRIGRPEERKVAVLFIDITKRRRDEEVLRELNQNLEQRAEQRTQEIIFLKLRQEKEKLNAVVFALEQERTRIAEGLHNGVAQLLYAAQSRLQLVKPDAKKGEKYLGESVQILADAIHDTRRLSFELMPPVLKDFGLATALDTLMKRIVSEKTRLKMNIDLKKRLTEDLEISIYRIVQEAINNILKHADATGALIDISESTGAIKIKIADNGKGFLPKEIKKHQKGIGLQTIENRVKLLEGSLKFKSLNGQGTVIEIRLPLKC